MKWLIIGLLFSTGCATTQLSPRGCPELDSRASCMATGIVERNMN